MKQVIYVCCRYITTIYTQSCIVTHAIATTRQKGMPELTCMLAILILGEELVAWE